jgi:hypothetical protein
LGFGVRDLRGTLSASRYGGNGQLPTFEADQSGGLMVAAPTNAVMAGLDPAIHLLKKRFSEDGWVRGSSPRMTA